MFGEEWLSRSSVVRKAWHTSRNHMKQDPRDFPGRVVLCHKRHVRLKVRCSFDKQDPKYEESLLVQPGYSYDKRFANNKYTGPEAGK